MSINNRLRSRNLPSSSATSASSNSALNKLNTTFNNFKTNALPNAEIKIKEKLDEMTPVLSNLQLKNLDEHKYSASGSTLLDPIFQVYWRWLVEQIPLYVAPNLLTVIGLILNVVTSTLVMLYSSNSDNDVPSWVLFLCAIGLFAYQSLDAIDGKQARRTNSSSPLGELFDHGCDAVSTVFVVIAFSTTLKLGVNPWFMFYEVILAMCAFYTAHWQTYVTGSLKFGKIDVTEAQATIYSIYFLTSIFGDSIWRLTLPGLNMELRYIPPLVGIIGSVSSMITNINIIKGGGKGKNGSSVADTSIVFPVFPLGLFFFLTFSIARKSEFIYLSNICLYMLTFGIVWAKITIKLIIAHMTKGEIYLFDSCLLGPIALLLNQYFNILIPEIYVLLFCFIFSTIDLFKYCSKVCYQICTHMNIYLFKITPPVASSQSSTSSSTRK